MGRFTIIFVGNQLILASLDSESLTVFKEFAMFECVLK